MLASSAVPAALVALMRLGTPESPRWLVSKGRIQEAREVIRKHLGGGYDIEEVASPAATQWRTIFRGKYGRRTLFVAVFWTCHTIPSFAIYTFAPQLLQALGATSPSLGAAIMSVFFLVGVFPAILLIDRIGRRPVLIVPYFVCAVMMGCLVVIPKASNVWISVCFIIYAIFSAGSSVLEWVYPSELFPTDVRASAMGFATSISRFGAAVGTFLFPIGLASLGVNSLMVIAGLICVFGGVVSIFWAPETRGMSLGEASGAHLLPAK
jgi:putative MFS transporter